MNRRHYAVTLQQASEESPTLARLTALTRDSSDRLKAIELLIPAALRLQQAGVPVSSLRAQGMLHGFANFSTLVPAVAKLLQEACAKLSFGQISTVGQA